MASHHAGGMRSDKGPEVSLPTVDGCCLVITGSLLTRFEFRPFRQDHRVDQLERRKRHILVSIIHVLQRRKRELLSLILVLHPCPTIANTLAVI